MSFLFKPSTPFRPFNAILRFSFLAPLIAPLIASSVVSFGFLASSYAETEAQPENDKPTLTCLFENSTVRVYTSSKLSSENPSTTARIQLEVQNRNKPIQIIEKITTLQLTEWEGSGHLVATVAQDDDVDFTFGARSALDSDTGVLKMRPAKQLPLISCTGGF